MKFLLALTLVASAVAQADPETFFFNEDGEPSNYVGLVSKGTVDTYPADCTSVSPFDGTDYCDLAGYEGDLAPDGTVTLLALYIDDPGFFGVFIGVEVSATGGFQGGQAVEVTGFELDTPNDMDAQQMPSMVRYAPDGRLWTADYTPCLTEEVTQFWWGTIDLTTDPAVFTGHFQVTSPDQAEGGYFSFADDGYEFTCPWYTYDNDDGTNDFGFGILGNYLYLNYIMDWDGYAFWAISLETEGVYTRTTANMIWTNWGNGFGDDIYPAGATDRGQGVFFIGDNEELESSGDPVLGIQTFDFSCVPTTIALDPTFITGDVSTNDWVAPVSAGRQFYYCEWPEGVCEDGVINDHFVVIGDGLVESECASVPTGRCGYTFIGCEDGYLPFGFSEGQETCNRTASEIGWSTTTWAASTHTFECLFGAGGESTECHKKCTATAQNVEYRGEELTFEVSCQRCDDPIVDDRRSSKITPVDDNTGFAAIVVAIGCDVGDLDCCNFVLSRAQCESGVELDLCFCGLADIDCPDPDCNESKKGLLGLLGLLGIIPLVLCSLLLLLCLLRRKKAGAPVPVATFDACAPPVLDSGFCTAPTFASVGHGGFPGTFVA